MPRLSKIGAAALGAFGWTSGGAAVSASYLVVAGGGGGSNSGGGAGGMRTGTLTVASSTSYTVTVGAGGAGGNASPASNGSDSVFASITSTGGGGGVSAGNNGQSGGSGGGGGASSTATTTGGSGTSGQGNAGGTNGGFTVGPYPSGGGGGAGAVGGNGVSTTQAGNGGAGLASSISGSSVTYAGGGGGAVFVSGNTPGTGGAGGGGSGSSTGTGDAGTPNTGGGGGGANQTGGQTGGKGGSGIVIISYVGAQQFGGGVVTSSGGNTIHTFTTSGTLSPLNSLSASYLIVAGGGGGGRSTVGNGGGGAGGLLSGSGVTIDTNSIYLVTVGAGGNGATTTANGSNGSNSTFSMVTTTAVGGGGGDGAGSGANAGGSGGGGRNDGAAGGAGTAGQGFAGGNGSTGAPYPGAGGGGASAVGQNSQASTGGTGGAGTASSISGASVTYAGGGGGGCYTGGTGAAGGAGGGGAGGNPGVAGTNGTANLGGGGGGGGSSANGGTGGAGVVIISYAGATQLMAGGTVTISGGNVIHTFNSSGYLTPLKLVNNSLRFRSSASAYLSRTPAGTGSRQRFTWSGWIKRGKLSATQYIYISEISGSGDIAWLFFNSSDQLQFYVSGSGTGLTSTQVFRDPAAWYHFSFAVDTTQATSSNRILLYVNGVQITAFTGTATYYTQNTNVQINTPSYTAQIGGYGGGYSDCYQTEINMIDGQQLTPNSFGTFNSYGVWQPITYGGSYGTNGFYLPFSNTASTTTLGYDFSPNGNNWTTNNISLTAGVTYDSMTDVPTLTSATASNYCVLNPLDKATSFTITNGNLSFAPANTSDLYSCRSTIQIPSTGKWIWQVTNTNSAYMITAGLISGSTALTGQQTVSCAGITVGAIGTFFSTTQWMNTTTSWSITNIGNGDTLVIAYDADAGKIWFGRVASGGTTVTWYNTSGTADPSTGTDPRASGIVAGGWFAGFGTYFTPSGASVNYGQQPFAFTNMPTNYVALNTYNL